MKVLFHGKALIILAVAVSAAISTVSLAQDQPVQPPPAAALPVGVLPGSPLADVIKMVQAGVDEATIQGYIANAQTAFNLDADKILYLKDAGVPSELINAMMARDKALFAATMAPAPAGPVASPSAPAPEPVAASVPDTAAQPMPDTAPPPADVTMNYFQDNLSPYGTWMNIDGYGQCWRPTVVIYDTSWRPYCDRGHWVYTDYGWYWDSDYAWGMAFHYGRWFHHARYGWCWYPDNVWAPSWVTWRSGDEYCGWAPLPPFAVFTPGVGFYYEGASVGVDFDFGLGADCFVFLSPDHLCDRHPSSFCVQSRYVTQIFHQTTVVNNYNVSSRTIVNRGIGVDRIASVTHRPIEPVHLSTLPNATRQGWHGESFQPTTHTTANANNHPLFNNNNNNAGHTFSPGNAGNNHVAQGFQQGGYQTTDTSHSQGQSQAQGGGNNNVQSQTINHEQPQVQQTHAYNTYNAGSHVAAQTTQSEGQQSRYNNNAPASGGSQQHGSEQLQQHESVESGGHNAGPASSAGNSAQGQQPQQPQQHSGGAQNNGQGGPNKQNQ